MNNNSIASQHTDFHEVRKDRIDIKDFDDIYNKDTRISLTLKDAVTFYGLSKIEIKAKIKNGEIPALKFDTLKGKKWRVFPEGIPFNLEAALLNKQEVSLEKEIISNEKTVFQEKIEFTHYLKDSTFSLRDSDISAAIKGLYDLESPTETNTNTFCIDNNITVASWKDSLEVKIQELENNLAEQAYLKDYLETKISALEDQLNYLTKSFYNHSPWYKQKIVVAVLTLVLILLFAHFLA